MSIAMSNNMRTHCILVLIAIYMLRKDQRDMPIRTPVHHSCKLTCSCMALMTKVVW